MDLPSFAPYPPPNLRKDIVPEEWESCLHAWLLLAEGHLLLSPETFSTKVSRDQSLIQFLFSYVDSEAFQPNPSASQSHITRLRRLCFLLVHRCLSELKKKPELLLEWHFISSLGILYGKWSTLPILLQDLWRKGDLDKTFQKRKVTLTKTLEDAAKENAYPDLDGTLARVAALLRVCSGYGESLMLGSDFIDALSSLYDHASAPLKKKLIIITYRCFLALMDPLNSRFSMMLDHLYALNSSKQQNPLLAAVCSSTPFVRRLWGRIAGPEAMRAEKIIQRLSEFEGLSTLPPRPEKSQRLRASKGKGKEKDEYGHGAFDGGLHVHRMSLVTQIQDLFPDLGSAFIVKLLDEYEDGTEQVTAHLLDDSLPPHLKSLDRSENLPHPATQPIYTNDLVSNLAPHPSPPLPPIRRNIHDNDAFDRLIISPTKIHRGRKSSSHTADTVLQDRSSAPNKAAILSALAAFDSDDDERDDTYDVDDVGGTVDAAIPGSDEMDADLRDKNEEALFRAWKMSPDAFERDAGTRRGKARMALRSETGMTDEAIEGWGIMLGRNPRRLRRLEARFEVFGGQQRELGKTSYREGGGSGTEESDRGERSNGGRARVAGGFRGRERGGRGGGAGDVAGPADEKGTQVARPRKDANKGGRANHNRRNQRAKKMARAGFPA